MAPEPYQMFGLMLIYCRKMLTIREKLLIIAENLYSSSAKRGLLFGTNTSKAPRKMQIANIAKR